MQIHYHKEDSDDLSRIDYQTWGIYLQLSGLQERI